MRKLGYFWALLLITCLAFENTYANTVIHVTTISRKDCERARNERCKTAAFSTCQREINPTGVATVKLTCVFLSTDDNDDPIVLDDLSNQLFSD